MSEYWNAKPSSGTLTREVFNDFLERVANAPPDPCSLGKHVVSATAFGEGWTWATCANCYRTVRLRQATSDAPTTLTRDE